MLNHRTTDFNFAIRTLSDKYITHATKGKLYTCFIEFKKAFDSVWHAYFASYSDTTLEKNSMTWLRLSIPKYNVFWLNMVSKEVNSLITVEMSDKAASFLRCFLNASCLNESLSRLINKTRTQYYYRQMVHPWIAYSIQMIWYLFISRSADGLQNALFTLSKFCSDRRMYINTKKTKAVIFQKKQKN